MSALVFDYGSKHIGVAAADEQTGVVTPIGTVRNSGGRSTLADLSNMVEEWSPAALVVGLPVNMDSTPSPQGDAAQRFGRRIQSRFDLPVHYVDERLSTFEARDRLGSHDRNDAAAAAVIAETWLGPRQAPLGSGHSPKRLQQRLDDTMRSIRAAAEACGRQADDVSLLLVSKSRQLDEILTAIHAGHSRFGENYVQEAVDKISQVSDQDIEWRFIGSIQSNKARDIARHFDWVESVDRRKIASRLNHVRGLVRPDAPLNVCIQVNIDREQQKAGVDPDEVLELISDFSHLSHLRLRGLMAIPKAHNESESVRPSFQRLRELFNRAAELGLPHWDTLSMGMSADYRIAIEEGATEIRLGTAVFGPRT